MDGGYIMAGETDSQDGDVHGYHESPIFNYTTDFWVIKLTSTGSIGWDKAYGGILDETAYSVQQTSDGGFMVTGWTESPDGLDINGSHIKNGGAVYADCWVIKLDLAGILQWQKCLGGSGSDFGFSGLQTTDGGYIIVSYTNSNDGDVSGWHGDLDYWVAKLDISGNIQWQKCYGGSSLEIPNEIQQTADGGYIIAGESYSTDGDVKGLKGKNDYWLVKISNAGTLEWQKCLGGTSYEESHSVKQTSDGGYILAGVSTSVDGDLTGNKGSNDFWVIKLGPPPCISSIKIFTSDSSICSGAAVTFHSTIMNGGSNPTYQWLVNSVDTGTDSSNYTTNSLNDGDSIVCRLASNAGCAIEPITLSDTIIENVKKVINPFISISASSSSICRGTIVVFTATTTGGSSSPSFQWIKNGENVGMDSTIYIDSTLNNNDLIFCILTPQEICSKRRQAFSDTVIIRVNPVVTPSIEIDASTKNICEGADVSFNAVITNAGTSPVYQWRKNGLPVGSNSSIYTDNLLADDDTITCNLISGATCALKSNVVSNAIPIVIQKPINVSLGDNETICEGGNILLSPHYPFESYLWQNGSTDSTYLAEKPGTYYLRVSDMCNHISSDTILIKVFAKVRSFLPKDTAVCSYTGIVLKSTTAFKNYLWNTSSVSSSINVNSPGVYWLEGTDNNNCKDYDTVVISSKDCEQGFYIPNAFTPNGDGINDNFKPLLFGNIDSYKFTIFNQWGQSVFESTNISKGWDGNYKGLQQDSNVFVWICKYKLRGDAFNTKHGTVMLLR